MDLLSLKKKHDKIVVVSFMGLDVYFRLLTWKEFKDYNKLLTLGFVSKIDLYDQVFKDCVFNDDLKNDMYSMPAGVVDSVSGLIFHMSGNPLNSEDDMNSFNEMVNVCRNTIQNNIYEQYVIIICKAFPSYTPHDLDKLDWQEFLRVLLLAEAKLKMPNSQTQAVAEGAFVTTQWPENADVNLRPREEEKKKTSLSDQIKQDTMSMLSQDPSMVTNDKQVLTDEEVQALKRHRVKEAMERKRAGQSRRAEISRGQQRIIQEREEAAAERQDKLQQAQRMKYAREQNARR